MIKDEPGPLRRWASLRGLRRAGAGSALVPVCQLLTEVWGPGYTEAAGNLRLYMTQLRRKLEPDPARPRWLITEPGMGYRYQPGPDREAAEKDY